jgi:hypothetical protein
MTNGPRFGFHALHDGRGHDVGFLCNPCADAVFFLEKAGKHQGLGGVENPALARRLAR